MTDSETTNVTDVTRKRPKTAGGTAERRNVTAMFCDVVNSTGLAEQLDPEDWTDLMNEAFPLLTAAVERYGGTVSKFMGDGMLAFFGVPNAHEDDPQRAVLAGLDMIAAAKAFANEVQSRHGLAFNVRVGINTGPVVVSDVGAGGAMEQTAMGDAVNVAARMEQTAEPDTVQISGDTYRQVTSLFEVEPLGAIELKGKTEPVAAYRVIRVNAEPERIKRRSAVGAPLIGREREFGVLKEVLDRVREGRGQIVSLIGDAGLGKSRLLAELNAYWTQISGQDRWEVMYGIPYDSTRPFGLFQNYARQMFGIELDDPADIIHQKVVERVRNSGANEEAVALCSVAFERVIAAKELHEAKEEFPAEALRRDIYEQMYPGVKASCSDLPTVMMVDDMQWGDPASIDLLLHLLPLTEEVPVLFLFAFRPERQSPAWKLKIGAETDFPHRYTEVNLKPLSGADTDSLVSALLNIDDLPPDLTELIRRKTEGNPYFAEEIVRSLIEQGAIEQIEGALRWNPTTKIETIKIPDSLQALLMARIDRLDQETKSTLQLASVIGRSFYYRILQAISDSAMAVDKHMSALERVELLREAGRKPELEYIFKHELARDAAYATILNKRRREFHLRVGEAIEALFADSLEEQAHRLAQHFSLGGDSERAMKYYEMAGELAAGIDGKDEALAHYDRALEVAEEIGAPADAIARVSGKRSALAMGPTVVA